MFGYGLVELRCIHPSVRTSVSMSTKSFFLQFFDVIWCMGRPRPDMHTSVTSTWSKVKVMGLLKFRKLRFSRSISSAILAWSSKLMVGNDIVGSGLQLFGAQFLNFLQRKLSWVQSSRIVDIIGISKGCISVLLKAADTVGPVGSPTCIVHADMTLTQSKVKVTELPNFLKLPKIALF